MWKYFIPYKVQAKIIQWKMTYDLSYCTSRSRQGPSALWYKWKAATEP